MAEHAVAESVMHRAVRCLRGGRRSAYDVDDRDVLGVAAGDRVDRTELADAVGGEQRRDPAEPAVAVGRVPGVELVRRPGPAHGVVVDDVVEEREAVVARDAEDAVDVKLREPVQQVIGDGVSHGRHRPAPVGSLCGELRALSGWARYRTSRASTVTMLWFLSDRCVPGYRFCPPGNNARSAPTTIQRDRDDVADATGPRSASRRSHRSGPRRAEDTIATRPSDSRARRMPSSGIRNSPANASAYISRWSPRWPASETTMA